MRKKHLVPRSDGELMYSTPPTLRRYLPMFLNLAVYMVTFVLWLYLDTAYYGFGHKIITPLTGSMWIVGAVFALLLPSQREEIIRHTKWFILGYLGILFVSGGCGIFGYGGDWLASKSALDHCHHLPDCLLHLPGQENPAVLWDTVEAACDPGHPGYSGQYQTLLNHRKE